MDFSELGIDSDIVAALASKGITINIDNNHPFTYGTTTFMHNGTIRPSDTAEQFISEKYKPLVTGTTDSERFFYAMLSQVDELGLVDLANELREAPVEEILDNFGAIDRRDDPVVHFYEDFLDFFDKDQRKDLGAYYTVVPVVQFMVRAVDEILRQQFSLELGIADASTWREVSKKNGFKIPKGIDADTQFVKMIDPATGTGTFLLEWIRVAKQGFVKENGGKDKDWPFYASSSGNRLK